MLVFLLTLLCCAVAARWLVDCLWGIGNSPDRPEGGTGILPVQEPSPKGAGRPFSFPNDTESVADRLVLWAVLGMTLFLCVPLATGFALGSVHVPARLVGYGVALVATGAWHAWLRHQKGKRGLGLLLPGESLLVAWRAEMSAASWKARAAWGVVVGWVALAAVPGWFLQPRFVDAAEYHAIFPIHLLTEDHFSMALRHEYDLAPTWWWAETFSNLKAFGVLQLAEARGGSLKGAGLIQAAFALVWLLAFWAAGRRLELRGAALAAGAFVFVSMPDFILQLTEIYSDVQGAAAVCVAVWGLLGLALSPNPRRWIVPVALGLGQMVGAKSSLVLATGLLGLVSLVIAWRRGTETCERMRFVGGMLLAGLIAGHIMGGPWILRSWIVYGNPLFPLKLEAAGHVIFDGPVGADLNSARVRQSGLTWLDLYWRPPFETLGVTHLGNRLSGHGPATLGLIVPSVVALLVGWWRERKRGWGLVLLLVGVLVVGIPDIWWPRYSLAVVTLGALAFAWLLTKSSRLPRTYFLAVLTAAALWNGIRVVPAVLGWPRPPVVAAYPFLTGDAWPETNWAMPGEYTARDFAREELTRDAENWVGGIMPDFSTLWMYHRDHPFQPVGLPQIKMTAGEDEWIAQVLASRATHILARLDSPEYEALHRHPDSFALIFQDTAWSAEHPWGPWPYTRESVWEVRR